MAEVLRCQAVEVVPYFKPYPTSYAAAPSKPRRINFDERPSWKKPYTPTFDPIQDFTNGLLTVEQFLHELTARSPENDALVDVLFALLRQCAFEDAKEETPPELLPLLKEATFTKKMFSDVATDFRTEFARVKYMPHLYHVFITMSSYIASTVRMETLKREKRSAKQKRARNRSSTSASRSRAATFQPTVQPPTTPEVPAVSSQHEQTVIDQQNTPFITMPLAEVPPPPSAAHLPERTDCTLVPPAPDIECAMAPVSTEDSATSGGDMSDASEEAMT